MAAGRFVLPYQTVIDPTGVPIPGAQLFFYISGTDTPLNTYADAALTVPNTNPVIANSSGMFPNIFMQPQPYKVVLTDSLLAEIWTADPVEDVGAGGAQILDRRQVSGDTTVLSTDAIIEVDCTSGDVTITYPLALGSAVQVQPVTIVKIDNTTNKVNIKDDGSATLRGAIIGPATGSMMASNVVYSIGNALRII